MKHTLSGRLIIKSLTFSFLLFSFTNFIHATVKPIYPGENLWKIVKRIGCEVDDINTGMGDCATSTELSIHDASICSKLEKIDLNLEQLTSSELEHTLSILEDISSVSDKVMVNMSLIDFFGEETLENLSDIDALLTKQATSICDKIHSLHEDVTELTSDVDEVSQSVNEALDCTIQLKKNVSIVDSKIDTIDDKIGDCTICDELSIIDNKIDSIDNKLGDCDICGELSIIDSKIDSLILEVDCATKANLSITESNLSSQLDAHDQSVCDKLHTIRDNVSIVDSKIDAINAKLSDCDMCDDLSIDDCCIFDQCATSTELSIHDYLICSKLEVLEAKIDKIGGAVCSTVITNADIPYTITEPGIYCLVETVSYSTQGQAAITIDSDDVVLKLNEFKITTTNDAVVVNDGLRRIIIQDGFIESALTGIQINENCSRITIQNCRVEACENGYSFLGTENNTIDTVDITNCIARFCQQNGFYFDYTDNVVVNFCIATQNAEHGFFFDHGEGYLVTNCTASKNGATGFKLGGETKALSIAKFISNKAFNNVSWGFDMGESKGNIDDTSVRLGNNCAIANNGDTSGSGDIDYRPANPGTGPNKVGSIQSITFTSTYWENVRTN